MERLSGSHYEVLKALFINQFVEERRASPAGRRSSRTYGRLHASFFLPWNDWGSRIERRRLCTTLYTTLRRCPTVGLSIVNSWKNKMIAMVTDCPQSLHSCLSRVFKSACKRPEPETPRNLSKCKLKVEWRSAKQYTIKNISSKNQICGTYNFWWFAPINARISK